MWLWFEKNCFIKNTFGWGWSHIYICLVKTIVFKLGPVAGPVQDPGSGFWPGHRVGPVNPYLKKIQNNIVLVKKTKVNGLQPGFAGSPGRSGHTGSWLFLFFHQPGPIPAPGRPPGRVSKLWLKLWLKLRLNKKVV